MRVNNLREERGEPLNLSMHDEEVRRFWDELASLSVSDQEAIGSPKSGQFSTIAMPEGLENRVILDIGCGYGRYAVPLAKHNEVIGIDVSRAMLQRLKRNSRSVASIIADAKHLPFIDETFDAIISIATLYYIDKWEFAIYEIARVLKLNGLAILDFRGYSIYNILREITLRSLKMLGCSRPWRYGLRHRLTIRRYVRRVLSYSKLKVLTETGKRIRFQIEATKSR